MKKLDYLGRPDGLGNRIEELIKLEAFSLKKNIPINYVWTNLIEDRNYSILVKSQNIEISKERLADVSYKSIADLPDMIEGIDSREILESAKNIKPTFNIGFEDGIRPIGVHIRGTDRILNTDHPHFMKNRKELFKYLNKTISLINHLSPQSVFVCSDDNIYRKIFIKHLDKKISIVNPISDANVPPEYIDFFALSLCQKIYMCSKFSSFATTASMIANIPVVAYTQDAGTEKRYTATFLYDTNLTDIKPMHFDYVLSSWFSNFKRLKRKQRRLKQVLKNWIRK